MRHKNRRGTDKVIHVVFGPGGGRVDARPQPPAEAPRLEGAAYLTDAREPITDLFSGTEVSRLLGLSPGDFAPSTKRASSRRAAEGADGGLIRFLISSRCEPRRGFSRGTFA